MIHVVGCGPLNTVQDLGRAGYRNIGVTATGAMDPIALKVGNLLVGNEEDAAGIEIQTFPFRIEFDETQVFSLTGADCSARLDGQDLPRRKGASPRAFHTTQECACLSLFQGRHRCAARYGFAKHVASRLLRRPRRPVTRDRRHPFGAAK